MTDSPSSPAELADRRVDGQLRARFVEIYAVLEPFFDPENAWSGQTHEHLAYRSLHERFPDLSGEQVFIIVAAAKRVFASGRLPTP